MQRFARPLAAIAMLTALAAPAVPAMPLLATHAFAAPRPVLAVQAVPVIARPTGGATAGLFVHAPAFTDLMLRVSYAGGLRREYLGKTDRHGRYVFSWTLPADRRQAGSASLDLRVRRGTLRGHWSGLLAVQRAPLPPLFVKPLAGRFLAGTDLGIFVKSAPATSLTYTLTAADGKVVGAGRGVTDGQGRYVISAPDHYLPRRVLPVAARIAATTPAGTSTASARFLLLPRPPLLLRATEQATRPGEPFNVVVMSRPRTQVNLAILLGTKVLAQDSGVTDGQGRLRYSTILNLVLKQPASVKVLIKAANGIDAATTTLSVRLEISRPGLVDRLATRIDPTPNLSRYFTAIPDKLVVVSTEGQTAREYEHGVLVHESYVTTGRPELPTPHGTYTVFARYTPYEMISPWPGGSPFYYPPTMVHYALEFLTGGYFLHDATWRSSFGPGTNLPHSDPGDPFGSHGCVNFPLADTVWLWNWAPIGTTVLVF